MKRILIKIISFSLILATIMSISSCSKSKTNDISYAGLELSLPSYMSKKAASDFGVYENDKDGTRVCIYYYSEADIAEELGAGATVKTYADKFVQKNKIQLTEEKYDEKKNTVTLKYNETVEETEKYCYDYILRNEAVLYHVRMSCKAELKGDYAKSFKKWAESAKIEDKLLHYSESGLNFSLPSYMQTINVNYADLCFGNNGDNTQFFIYFYSSEALLTELFMDKDSTVKEYADWFVNNNGYENVSENYDEENKKIVLRYVYEPESTFYCDTVLRNEYSLIHVTMCCDENKREIYEPIFNEWISYLSLVYQ